MFCACCSSLSSFVLTFTAWESFIEFIAKVFPKHKSSTVLLHHRSFLSRVQQTSRHIRRINHWLLLKERKWKLTHANWLWQLKVKRREWNFLSCLINRRDASWSRRFFREMSVLQERYHDSSCQEKHSVHALHCDGDVFAYLSTGLDSLLLQCKLLFKKITSFQVLFIRSGLQHCWSLLPWMQQNGWNLCNVRFTS